MIPTSSTAAITAAKTFPKNARATVIAVTAEPIHVLGDLASLPAEIRSVAETLVKFAAKGKIGETVSGVTPQGHRVFVIGLGPKAKVTIDSWRRVGGSAHRIGRRGNLSGGVAETKSTSVDVAVLVAGADEAAAVAEGALLASWEFADYVGSRRAKETKAKPFVNLSLVGPTNAASLDHARIVAESANFARTIASRPGNDINPVTLAAVAKQLAGEVGLKYSVLDEKQMKKLGMGGMIGVGQGSATPPRMIVLEHKPAKVKAGGKPLLVIGKSITFDTGGISIKPADRMQRMIYDKSGGMAVLGLMHALAKTKSPVHVVGILAAAENHVSGTSYRPGDILTFYNGITAEITNTDAEGRLVLGDAVSWGIETYKPAAVVDLATLTGGCVVALGTIHAGLFANDDALAAEITAAGAKAGEKYWRLPCEDEHREMLKSDLADVQNSCGRYASPCTGAAFISLFVPTDEAGKPAVPWVHLDIAGMSDTEKELPYLGKGAMGFGVRTLVEWVVGRGGK